MLDTITINGTSFPRPVDFKPQREDIYASEIKTMTGNILADRVGWRYSDITLTWEALTNSQVAALAGISGAVSFAFDDVSGEHSEQVMRTSVVAKRHKYQIGGVTYWKSVSVSLRFLEAHS